METVVTGLAALETRLDTEQAGRAGELAAVQAAAELAREEGRQQLGRLEHQLNTIYTEYEGVTRDLAHLQATHLFQISFDI